MTATSRSSRIAIRTRPAISRLVQFVRAIAIELRRLNRARIDSARFASMRPRERRTAVKAALAAHHRNNSRCC
jgi:hypothetical protein